MAVDDPFPRTRSAAGSLSGTRRIEAGPAPSGCRGAYRGADGRRGRIGFRGGLSQRRMLPPPLTPDLAERCALQLHQGSRFARLPEAIPLAWVAVLCWVGLTDGMLNLESHHDTRTSRDTHR